MFENAGAPLHCEPGVLCNWFGTQRPSTTLSVLTASHHLPGWTGLNSLRWAPKAIHSRPTQRSTITIYIFAVGKVALLMSDIQGLGQLPSFQRDNKAQEGNGCTRGWTSYLDPSHSELGQRSAHLGGRCLQVLPAGDDFDQQGVVVRWNDSALEGGGAVQTDAHAFTASEDLRGNRTEEQRVNNINRKNYNFMSQLKVWRESR